MPNFNFFLLGMAGAASLELLKLYEYRSKLSQKKYRALMRSLTFWALVAGMLLASGFIAWAYHADAPNVSRWTVVITGIAARSITREITASRVAAAPTNLGDGPSLRDIFL
jgi:cell division septal protein FtsQ